MISRIVPCVSGRPSSGSAQVSFNQATPLTKISIPQDSSRFSGSVSADTIHWPAFSELKTAFESAQAQRIKTQGQWLAGITRWKIDRTIERLNRRGDALTGPEQTRWYEFRLAYQPPSLAQPTLKKSTAPSEVRDVEKQVFGMKFYRAFESLPLEQQLQYASQRSTQPEAADHYPYRLITRYHYDPRQRRAHLGHPAMTWSEKHTRLLASTYPMINPHTNLSVLLPELRNHFAANDSAYKELDEVVRLLAPNNATPSWARRQYDTQKKALNHRLGNLKATQLAHKQQALSDVIGLMHVGESLTFGDGVKRHMPMPGFKQTFNVVRTSPKTYDVFPDGQVYLTANFAESTIKQRVLPRHDVVGIQQLKAKGYRVDEASTKIRITSKAQEGRTVGLTQEGASVHSGDEIWFDAEPAFKLIMP